MIDIYSIYLERLKCDKYKIKWPVKMPVQERVQYIQDLILYCETHNDIDSCLKLNDVLTKIKKRFKE